MTLSAKGGGETGLATLLIHRSWRLLAPALGAAHEDHMEGGPEYVKNKAGRHTTPDDLADRRVVTRMAEPRRETFRATLRIRTPDGEWATLIVTRQGLGTAGRTWLTFHGAIKTTAVLTSEEAGQLAGQLDEAAAG
ncbi:MAG: hypothetical protein ACRDRV_03510 [Pseudonocardiaceae bacterium]